jgi:hypothetical protein
MSRKATIRRYTSLGHLEDAVYNALQQHFPERDIELFKQWHAGAPLTSMIEKFGLKRREVEQIIKDIEERIDSCLSWYRVEALLNLKPIKTREQQPKILPEIDEALVKIAALRVDRIAENEACLRTVIRHQERYDEFSEDQSQDKRTSQWIEVVTAHKTPLIELGLSCRAYNAVSGLGAKFVEDVCGLSKNQLELLRSCGPVTINEIEKALLTRGVELRP